MQGEMQEALKALDMGVAAAQAESRLATAAGRRLVTLKLIVAEETGPTLPRSGASAARAALQSKIGGAKAVTPSGPPPGTVLL